jgi:riboflavin kinase/FMN adenylyltransferase
VQIHNIQLDSQTSVANINLAIGNFDGVHLGHQKIIDELIEYSKIKNCSSAILSFKPHPRQFFSDECRNFQIITEDEKIHLLDKQGIDHYFSLLFDENIASMLPKDFITKILIEKLHSKYLIVGYDFKFGKERKGNASLLQEQSKILGFDTNVIQPITSDYNAVVYSSSRIREFIRDGNMVKANLFLGRNWSMKGTVIKGDRRATVMNFPTANLVPGELIHPKKGVYAIRARCINKWSNGIANFGERPTVDGKRLLLEAHLFEFNQDIYGKELTVEFLTFIREEKKFDNFASLAEQVQKDIQLVKAYHSER